MIVIAELDFVGNDRVVFIDHGNGVFGKEGCERRAGVEITATLFGVVQGEENLRGGDATSGQGLRPGVGKGNLADCRSSRNGPLGRARRRRPNAMAPEDTTMT